MCQRSLSPCGKEDGAWRAWCRLSALGINSEQLLSDLGVLGGRYAGLPPALFRYRNVRSLRSARDLRITWPHGPRARQCHYDKSGREDRPHDGICFEPSIECAPVLPGQPL
jgi:hypothetical protein